MNADHDTNVNAMKLIAVWFSTTFGVITLNQWVLGATLIYTILQIAISLKKLFTKAPKHDPD